MVKTNAQKQKEYRERVKAKQNSEYLKKDRERKRLKRELLKKSPGQYQEYKRKDRERKAAKKAAEQSLNSSTDSTPKRYSKQALGKAKHRAIKHLPQSPEKRKQIITHLLQSLSPSSKSDVYKKARLTSTPSNRGRPSVSDTVKDKLLSFLKQPDISYCNPGRKDTVYMGKDASGERVYAEKYYLLWNLREIVTMFNSDQNENTSYHTLRKVVAETKNIFTSINMKDDDCRCSKCENVELMLNAIKNALIKNGHNDYAITLKTDADSFMGSIVCSVKNQECCEGNCLTCGENDNLNAILSIVSEIEEITYSQWIREKERYVKREFVDRGAEIVIHFKELSNLHFRLHMYNIYRQFSELKYLKRNLKSDEIILSVDFSRNYENKQLHEIQSAYFGHEAFTVFTCACYHLSLDSEVADDEESGLKLIPIAVISNEVTHERNIAYHCNQKVIQMVQNKLSQVINTVYIWSDGCASQFRSQYVFRTLSFYPSRLKVFWDYGEAHHFKGPHDGIGGTIKRCVYNDVRASKVILRDAKHFAEYANEKLAIDVAYLDKAEITLVNVEDSVPVPGTLTIHHVERISSNLIELYKNSNYKVPSKLVKSIQYQEHSVTKKGPKPAAGSSVGTNKLLESNSSLLSNNKGASNSFSNNVGDVILVRYTVGKRNLYYLGVIQHISHDDVFVQFLKRSGEKTFTIKDGDTDTVSKGNVLLKLDSVSVNSRGQYVVDEILDVNLDN